MTNGWSLYKKSITPWIRTQYPQSKFHDWSKIASKMWHALTEQQRAEWKVRAREEHQARFPEYTPPRPSAAVNQLVPQSGLELQSVAEFANQRKNELPTDQNYVLPQHVEPQLASTHGIQSAPRYMSQYGNPAYDHSSQGQKAQGQRAQGQRAQGQRAQGQRAQARPQPDPLTSVQPSPRFDHQPGRLTSAQPSSRFDHQPDRLTSLYPLPRADYPLGVERPL
ncbi:hypothetical protein F5Y18DRAFT_271934 [Xylariaceae sp. FL1019]|nr:hypothetical protein F5Y18DRAFT_271934 [Xylariaceae sp. FL1019]